MNEESENEFGDEILDDGMDERPAQAISYEPIALGGMEDAPEGTEAKLKGFPNPDIKEKFFKNMSSRAAEMLKDDMESKGPVKITDVERSQQNILKVCRKLEEEGAITLGGLAHA